jgi:RNA polymerase sigma factor for flagellar operon FliA
MSIEKCWKKYKTENDLESKDFLVTEHLYLVRYVVNRIISGSRGVLKEQFDDLVSSGVIGLIDAIEKFDMNREVQFKTYAIPRIRGAIIDSLRKLDWASRSVRRTANELDNVYNELTHKLMRNPTDEEWAAEAGIDVDELHFHINRIHQATILQLYDSHSSDDDTAIIDYVQDNRSPDAAEETAQAELIEILVQEINNLPQKEKLVLSMYYYEGLTFKEIGAVLSVTESRVCQIHSQAIGRLRKRLGRRKDDFM